ncbi:MAG: hypothetical protein FWB86_00025 [Treponema sp.]|nr:hypothetical protein [Treponema sp.]MCL2251562.1 hypothetical protein [Treponema sp.]
MKEEGKAIPNKISLILGTHAHIPSGAPENEFEYVYENKLRPFISNLYRYPNINAVLHYSGVLLYWIERTHSELFMLIEDMIGRKQIEILGGGFYEPMFPLIPLQDRIGQIEFMTTYIRKHFGKRPAGCWLPGMIWEQHLANTLSASDMTYTFLSQDQFKMAGVKGEGLFYPCISEDQGKYTVIFPVSLNIEKELAEKSFSQTFVELNKKFLKENKSNANTRIVCVFPDKILSSPEEAIDTAWNRFFEEISLSQDIVETVLPFKILKNQKKYKKICFPNSSAFTPEANRLQSDSAFILNDFSPRRFIIEDEEANDLYAKMIFVNVLVNSLKGDKARKLIAREELWKAQDSFLFFPSYGYLRNKLRKAAYSSLLRAESMTRDKGKFALSLIQYDFDFDGIKEYLFQDSLINCYIRQKGAAIFELDYLPKEWNYLDCGSDANYTYKNDKNSVILNRNINRAAFADMLLSADTDINNLADIINSVCDDLQGRLCFNEYYEAVTQDKKGKTCFKLAATSENIPFNSIEITKCYKLKKDVITVSYLIKNTEKDQSLFGPQKFLFIPEIDLSFAGISEEYVRFYTQSEVKAVQDANRNENTSALVNKDIPLENNLKISNIKILDVKNEVQILFNSTNTFSVYLINSFNNDLNKNDNQEDIQKFYQATCILPVFSLSLSGGEIWKNDFSFKFSH